jgi:4-oxalocrotonate tautomerase
MRHSIVSGAPGARNVRGSMSGDVPDVWSAGRADHGHTTNRPDKEDTVPLIQVKLIEGVFTAPQKREIVERLTDALVAIEGESLRQITWCLVEEVASGEWGVGGQPLTADDVKALARGGVAAG